MDAIKNWFSSLEESEKKIVLFAAVFFTLVLLFFAVVKPLNDAVSRSQSKVNSLYRSVSDWQENLPLLMSSQSSASPTSRSRSLSNLVTSTTRGFGLNVSRVQEKGQSEMQVWFDNVPFNDFLQWVAELESKHQVSVDTVNIRSKDRDGRSSIDVKLIR